MGGGEVKNIHSFILKPARTLSKHPKSQRNTSGLPSCLTNGNTSSIWHNSLSFQGKESEPPLTNMQFFYHAHAIILVESKLFFKQPTSWQPRISKDLIISVASEISVQAPESDRPQLPVQVLTLQASNKTSENLTLTVLAPASFTSPAVTLSNSPSSPFSTFPAATEVAERVTCDRQVEELEMKEKGSSYVPEQSLKIHATSSISTGIF